MQTLTKTTYFGQHFLLSVVKNGKDTTLILSNSDETKNHVVFTDSYELKELAEFLNKVIQLDMTQSVITQDSECLKKLGENND